MNRPVISPSERSSVGVGERCQSSLAANTMNNVVLQVLLRASTFLANVFLLRHTSLALLGVVNVRLNLLYSTAIFFSREPFRRSCLGNTNLLSQRGVVNVLWLCPLVACVSAALLSIVWLWALVNPERSADVRNYSTAVQLYALSVVVEALAEPFWILFQNLNYSKLKIVAEGLQGAVRNLLTLLLVYKYPRWSLLSFAYSTLISSVVYVLIYYACFCYYSNVDKSIAWRSIGPRLFVGSASRLHFDKSALSLTLGFLKHGAVKQLLTEGERYVMTFFDVLNFADQGALDVVSNLGSLVARVLLLPLEESSYNYFSQYVERGKKAVDQEQRAFAHVDQTLRSLVKFLFLVGLTAVTFGQSYSYVALKLYAGERFCQTSAPTLLRLFSVYILLMALNGITECFMFASMRDSQVDAHRRYLTYFCPIFLTASVFLCRLMGSAGFILANCVNMTFRIGFSLRFLGNFYQGFAGPAFQMMPKGNLLAALLVSLFMTSLSNIVFCCNGFFNTLTHLIMGAVLFAGVAMTAFNSEPEMVTFVRRFLLKRRAVKSS